MIKSTIMIVVVLVTVQICFFSFQSLAQASEQTKSLSSSITIPSKVLGDTKTFDHCVYEQLLQMYVFKIRDGNATLIDYQRLQKSKRALDQYLVSASQVDRLDFHDWSADDRLAFLINVYNAKTIELVLDKYPNIESIKDLGSFFRPVWSKDVMNLLGTPVSLDDIEHEMIRGDGNFSGYGYDPRIHFAVNCASKGCPSLYEHAFTGDKLQEQLDLVTKRFLKDRANNTIQGGILHISKIFEWYEEDFMKGWRDIQQLPDFLALYSDALELSDFQTKALIKGQIPIKFNQYDWSLNDGRMP